MSLTGTLAYSQKSWCYVCYTSNWIPLVVPFSVSLPCCDDKYVTHSGGLRMQKLSAQEIT